MTKSPDKPALLLVDDDPLIIDSTQYLLKNDYVIHSASSREEVKSVLTSLTKKPNIALVDLGLPPYPHGPDEGFAVIADLLTYHSKMRILVLSGQDRDANVQHALTLGAVDFIAKPAESDLLKSRIAHQCRLVELEQLEIPDEQKSPLIGDSSAIENLKTQINLYAKTPFPVLIEGESGTGKELVAQQLHLQSDRRDQPFIIINCAAFTADLLDAQLFGHKKGAFTGAHKDEAGFFEAVGRGTLFLDEIGELPLALQSKLLRVMENGEFYRIGETQIRQTQARILAATNRHLDDEVTTGRFRQDLFHRLSVLAIKSPPVADRENDKMLLLEHFQNFYAGTVAPFSLTDDAKAMWLNYRFPGNVRELRNLVIRLGTKYPGQRINADQLSLEVESDTDRTKFEASVAVNIDIDAQLREAPIALDEAVQRVEHDYICAALRVSEGNLSRAARLLKTNRTTLYSKIQRLGIDTDVDESTEG